jgi:hypothetical protein
MSPSGSTESTGVAVKSNDVTSAGTAGMRVYIDPETGEVTGDVPQNAAIELNAAMENALRHDDEGLVGEKHANGAMSLNLQERYADVSVVRIDENGKMIFCSGDANAVVRGLNDTTTPTGPEVK